MKPVKEFYNLRLGPVVGDGGHFLELDDWGKGVGYWEHWMEGSVVAVVVGYDSVFALWD